MASEGTCYDNINHNILNRCFSLGAMNLLRETTDSMFQLLSTTIVLSFLAVLITALPFIFERSSRQMYGKVTRLYNVIRFTLIGVYRRIGYGYTVLSILMLVIKQPAPCKCTQASGASSQNMPYAYTQTAIVIAMTIFDFGSLAPRIAYPLGIVIGFVPNLFYLLSGWASLGQLFGTAFLAASLHIYSSHTSNKMMLIEGCILLAVNFGALVWYMAKGQAHDVKNSPVIRLFRGVIVLLYDIFIVLKFLMRNQWGYFSIQRGLLLVEDETSSLRSSLLGSDEEARSFRQMISTDKRDGIIALLALVLLKTIEYTLRDIKSL